jgi:hypothetical protein
MAENALRRRMGLPANVGLVERMAGGLPPGLSEPVDVAEQALLGGLGEGAGTAAFGIPGKVAGGLERGAAGLAERQAAKAEAGAVRKAAEVGAAREVGPETQAALGQATAARQASAARASHEIATAAGRPGAPHISLGAVADRMMRNNPRAYPDRGQLVDALVKELYEASREVHGVPERRMRFDLADLQHLKQTLDTFTSGAREAAAAGRSRPTGLAKNAGDAMRSLIEDHVPGVRAINAETKAAIKAEKGLRKFASRQPSGEVGAIQAGQRERTAGTLARQALEESAFQPRLTMRGIEVGTPRLARLAGGTQRFLARPSVAKTGRYGPDLLNALYRLMLSQPDTTGGLQ